MAVFSVLLLVFVGSFDFPLVEPATGPTLDELHSMSFEDRQTILLQENDGYLPADNGSGPLLSSVIPGSPGDLVLVSVYRSLTPMDLAVLDQAGLWPMDFSPDSRSFVALVQEHPVIGALTGSGFVKTIRQWGWEDAAASESRPWAGGWLVKMAPGFVPVRGVLLYGDWWRVDAPVERGALVALPDRSLPAVSHAVGVQADDSREVTGLPNLWNYYTGADVGVGVLDTGVWSSHPDLVDAVLSGPDDQDGHGTAVCGVIASRGDVDLGCEYNGSGGAPGADLYVIQRPEAMTPSEFASFYTEYAANDCFIINNSWGFDGYVSYDAFCTIVDDRTRGGLLSVFSAGNDPTPGSIPSPAIARNALTVGAVSFIPDSFAPDSFGNVRLAPYSGRGPTADGRLKPQILAPGGGFTGLTMGNGVATTNAMYGGSWLDDPANRWPGEPSYTRYAGTSMAAAFISAAMAVTEEKYGTLFNPEDALAISAACAIPLKSNTGSPASGYATTGSGYGLIDGYHLPGTYFSEEVDRLLWVNSVIQEGAPPSEWIMYVPAYTSWISLGLGYADLASVLPALKVDLDVTLISPSSDVYTYQLPAGVTAESPVERIVVENPQSGAWTVRVTAASWAQPGNPHEQQQFAVAAYRFARDPELAVVFPSDTTLFAPPGGQLTVPVTVSNTGGYVAVGTWTALVPPSGFSGDVGVPAFLGNLLYKNSQASTQFTLQCPELPGTYTVDVVAGAGNRNLSDATSQFSVLLAYPDLTVSVASPGVSPPFAVGQSVDFSAVVTNAGAGPSGATQLAYYVTDDPSDTKDPVRVFNVPPLESGESVSFNGAYMFTYYDSGDRYLVSIVDPDSLVIESDENNNKSVYGQFFVSGEFAPPESLVATSGNDGFIPLTWQPPHVNASGSKGLSSFRVYRSVSPLAPDPDPIAEIGADTVSWTDSLVVNGITYYYWVTGVYSSPDGESVYSNVASATAQGPTGSMAGYVRDAYTGRYLEDILVSVYGMGITATSDNSGYYYFAEVPVGSVPVQVDQQLYALFTDTVLIEENQLTEFNINLVRLFPPGMTVIPSPFTPNDDGINDTVSFVWPAAEDATIDLVVMNLEGVPVRRISAKVPVWDGRDGVGASLPSGIYIFHASAPVGEVTGTVCVAR